MTTYGSKIKKFRIDKGHTQEFMAESLKISQNAYCKIEKDQTQIRVKVLEQIAEILGIDKVQLMSDELPSVNIKQKNHDYSSGIVVNQGSIDEERKLWKTLEESLRLVIETQKELIEQMKK